MSLQTLAHRIAVLYRGRLIELGPSREVCGSPAHPYTQALISAVLEPDTSGNNRVAVRARDSDDLVSTGCPYAGRCLKRIEQCANVMPAWYPAGAAHEARCHLLAN